MSLFGKGNWSRFYISPEDLGLWQTLLEKPRNLFVASAFGARTLLLANPTLDTTVGINPPSWPCGDAPQPLEQQNIDRHVHPLIARNLLYEENATPWVIEDEGDNPVVNSFFADERLFGADAKAFQLYDNEKPIYGFWAVLHSRAGLDDMNALKEHAAAVSYSQPFKTLPAQRKKDLTTSIESDGLVAYIDRTQCPVILNFETGEVWIGTATKKLVDAVKFWLNRFAGITLLRVETSFGKNQKWASDALSVFVENDVFKLEREEAYEKAMAEEARNAEPVEDISREEIAAMALDTPEPKDEENGFTIGCISIFSKDNLRFAEVNVDAMIDLGSGHQGAVVARKPLDAMTLLKQVPTASLQGARVSFKDNVGDGIAEASVDFNVQLGEGVYKGLELVFSSISSEFLSEQAVKLNVLDEDEVRNRDLAPRINRFWFSYYLRLSKFERMFIETTCDALELTAETIVPWPISMGTYTTSVDQGPSTSAASAAKDLKRIMEDHLLPGESVTIASGSKSATIVAGPVRAPLGHAIATEIEI